MKLDRFKYLNEDKSIESSNKIILDVINDLMRFNDKLIDQIHIKVISGDPPQSENESNNSIHIDSNTLEIIDVNDSDINHLCELFNFLKSVKDLDILMDADRYKKFRFKFTNLYFKAFFDDNVDRDYAFDTDEINQILFHRKIECEITMQKIDGQIFYKIINKKEGWS